MTKHVPDGITYSKGPGKFKCVNCAERYHDKEEECENE